MICKERGFAMFGFLTLGSVLAGLDLTCKRVIEAQADEDFPREPAWGKGYIQLYKNHNYGFSFGVLKNNPLVERIPLCLTSGIGGAWFYLMGTKGRILEKLALTLTLAGGISNLYDRMTRGYVVDYFCIKWKALKRVVLNLGDLCIFAGAVLTMAAVVIGLIKDSRRKKNETV